MEFPNTIDHIALVNIRSVLPFFVFAFWKRHNLMQNIYAALSMHRYNRGYIKMKSQETYSERISYAI